ncbi:hypothetical protein AMTRI_Chr07g81710 [Amborella trichopoda]
MKHQYSIKSIRPKYCLVFQDSGPPPRSMQMFQFGRRKELLSSHLTLLKICTANGCQGPTPDITLSGDGPQQQRQRKGGVCRWRARLLNGSPVPLPNHPHRPPHCHLHHPRGQVPHFLSHPSPLSLQSLPEKTMWWPLIMKLKTNWIHSSRALSDTDMETTSEEEEEDNDEEKGDGNDRVESFNGIDSNEVERICKVIEDLLGSDGNMEAVLDRSSISVSTPVVVSVLNRLRHAWKPSFRFFRWASGKSGFSHNSETYNAMMGVLGRTRRFESMVEMLEEMGKVHCLSIETFEIAIRAFARAREMKKAVAMFELMGRHGFEAGIMTFNKLIDSLARAKLGKEAQILFEKMKDQFNPDLRTYSILLFGWSKVKNLSEAGKIWNDMIDKGFRPDIVAYNTMLEGLFLGNRRSEAIKLFKLMKAKGPSPNVRSYTIVIRHLCKGKKMEEAMDFFNEMLAKGCLPDPAVYTCLIVGFGNARKMDCVYGLLREMREKGCPPDGRTYNALIKLMTNRNMPGDAARVYKKMIADGLEPTFHTYNMLMKSYFLVKDYESGRAVWKEMAKKGICPDDNSYTVYIGGLIREGKSDEACKYIEDMINKGMKLPQFDYNKFAADFSRAGKPNILEELAQKMKFSGKFDVSNIFLRFADRMKRRVKRRDSDQTRQHRMF